MSKATWIVLASLAVVVAVGCNGEDKGGAGPVAPGQPVGVAAVVDLDRVAIETDVKRQAQLHMAEAQKKADASLKVILEPMQKDLENLTKEFNDLVKSIPEADRDKEDNAKKIAEARQKVVDKQVAMQLEVNKKREKLGAYDQKMTADFILALQPALRAICEQHKVRVLIAKPNSVYSVPDADLTNVLVDYLKAHPIQPPVPPPADL